MDPYQVLGVSRDATDDEIKKAYRSLSRKYHPDANINNPHKDLAEEKFKEVQKAYDQIMKERTYGGAGSTGSSYGDPEYGNPFGGFYGNPFGGFSGYGGSQTGSAGNENPHMQAAANYIRSGHYKEALHVLGGIPDKTALWYYYSAIANSGTGNNVTALEHAKIAVEMEPDNMQFQMYLNQLQGRGGWYQGQQTVYGFPMHAGNDLCCKLCLANIACNLCCNGACCCGPAAGGGTFV